VREAKHGDAPAILSFINALARYEKMAKQVEADEALIRATLFSENPRVFALIAEWDGKPAGFALWFYNYSTFLGRHGIWLEDFFVSEELRGKGIGKALLAALARRCADEGLGRLEWSVLDWNERSIRFYRSLGAVQLESWDMYRLSGEALHRLQSAAP
jgi:GNAT superfamily N-acetyltransferase